MRRILLLCVMVVSALGSCWAQGDPYETLVSLQQGSDGNIYGVQVGPDASGFFKWDPTSSYWPVLNGSFGGQLCLVGPDGNFYGLTGSYTPTAQIVRMTLSGVSSVFATLPPTTTAGPVGCPIVASDGNYYGASTTGGSYGQGFLYQVTPAGKVTAFYNFNGTTDGGGTANTPIEGSDGDLYLYNSANLLKYNRATGLTVIPESAPIAGQMVEGADGNFYGLDPAGEAVQRVQPSGETTPIYQNNGNAYQFMVGPFVDGDGTLSVGQTFVYTVQNCSGLTGDYLSFFPMSLSGVVGPEYFQFGYPGSSVDSYWARDVFLGGTGSYYGSVLANFTDIPAGCGGEEGWYIFGQAPAQLPTPPIQMTLSKTHVLPGASVDLSWQVNNAFSKTMQQCYGFGGLSGKLALRGSKTVTAPDAASYVSTIVCGGTEVGVATLTASATVPLTLTSSTTNVIHGLPVTLTAQIGDVGVPGPTGRVTFYNGSEVIGSAAVNAAGAATLTVSTHGLAAGTYDVTASYAGDSNYGPGTAAPVAITIYVGQEKTTLSLETYTPTLVAGEGGAGFSVTATGKISGQPPTGTVSFWVRSQNIGTALLGDPTQTTSSAYLNVSTTGIGPGNYSVTATYPGDGWNKPATSNAVTVAIVADLVSMAATPNPVPVGDGFTLSAVVASSEETPTGTVTFYGGTQVLGSATLDGRGAAVVPIPAGVLAEGSYQLTAAYSGDAASPAAVSAVVALIVR